MLRSQFKRWIKKALVRSSIFSLAGRAGPSSAAILMYHSVVENPSLTDKILGVSRSRASFEAHMETIARRFSPVSLEDVARFAKSGATLPRRAVAVTFDDGFADNYEEALPILNRYGVPATFYIMVDAVTNGTLPWYCRLRFAFNTTTKLEWTDLTTQNIHPLSSPEQRGAAMVAAWEYAARMSGKAQREFVADVEESLNINPANVKNGLMMTWDQIRSLRSAGHIIGAHTLSHPNLAQVTEAEATAEITGSKKRLEQELGEPVDHFSYPHPALNPQWSKRTLEITRDAGFKSAVLTTSGPVRQGDEPLALKRIRTQADVDQFTYNLECTLLGRSQPVG